MTMPEVLAATTVMAIAAGTAVPQLGPVLRARRLDGAARTVSMQMQRARMEALARGIHVGIIFERDPSGDRWRMHTDGGMRGIRSAEIAAGVDPPLGEAVSISAAAAGLRFGLPGTGPIPRVPPSRGTLSPDSDPIAFGSSDIFSASPTGTTSGGTLYITDGNDLRAVVVYGPTGRIRVWRYDSDGREWKR